MGDTYNIHIGPVLHDSVSTGPINVEGLDKLIEKITDESGQPVEVSSIGTLGREVIRFKVQEAVLSQKLSGISQERVVAVDLAPFKQADSYREMELAFDEARDEMYGAAIGYWTEGEGSVALHDLAISSLEGRIGKETLKVLLSDNNHYLQLQTNSYPQLKFNSETEGIPFNMYRVRDKCEFDVLVETLMDAGIGPNHLMERIANHIYNVRYVQFSKLDQQYKELGIISDDPQ